MHRIQVLPEEIVSKISAGEVVERPASVVKELVENSLDAQAKNIVIEIKNAGKNLIGVSDDGWGISKDDLTLALERHATSKISSLTELKKIQTLGFRGEALPSIAAVSKFKLISRILHSDNGNCIYAEGEKVKENYVIGAPVGTTVEVRDLFYNTPARLKFLKTDPTEKEQIFTLVYDLALTYPEVSFRLLDETKEILNCPRVDNFRERIAQLFGYQILEHLFFFTEEINLYKISGLLSYPSYTRATKRQQFFSVNNRPIRSRILQHSVYEGYRQFLSPGRHPAFFLYFQCPPEIIDVNVHPTKREIRFSEEENLHQQLILKIREKLLQPRTIPEIKIPVREKTEVPTTSEKYPQEVVSTKEATATKTTQEEFFTEKDFPSLTIIPLGQLGKLYILAQSDEGLLIIDQHAAEERILYEKFKNALTENKLETQRLLNPIIIELSLQEYEILFPLLKDNFLENLGFEIEEFGGRSFIVHSVPAILASGIDEKVIRDLLDILSEETEKEKNLKLADKLTEEIKEKIIRNACRSAVKAKDNLEKEQMYHLVEELKKCTHPYNCPHGRPTLIRLNYDELNHRFDR